MNIFDTLLSVIAPHECIACGQEGANLCVTCTAIAGEPLAPRCVGCHALSENWRVCATCRNWLPLYSVVVSVPYEGLYKQLLHSYKFSLQRTSAQSIASIMSEATPDEVFDGYVVCPIPTAPSRIRQRGFDHAKLIAREYASFVRLDQKTLLRRSTNFRQVGSDRAHRIAQAESAFSVVAPAEVQGAHILIVDDVTTTGATLAAAASTLKAAGARRVSAVVFAQSIPK